MEEVEKQDEDALGLLLILNNPLFVAINVPCSAIYNLRERYQKTSNFSQFYSSVNCEIENKFAENKNRKRDLR